MSHNQEDTNPTKRDHLSYEGFHAGIRFCGATDGTSCHLPYVADLDAWAETHIACAECRRILREAK